MSAYYSLRVYTNYDPTNPANPANAWHDMSDTLDLTQLPSISIGAERGDIPLTTVASDLSLTCNNGDGRWDALFDQAKIVGQIPMPIGKTFRAPLIHYGRILLCRKLPNLSNWQVIFFGFVNPAQIRFNRTDRLVTFTAFAPAKLLEQGNAERVNRIKSIVPARPFVTQGLALIHPANPSGVSDADAATDPSWWYVKGGVTAGLEMFPDDRFNAVRFIPAGGWVENMAVESLGGPFTVIQAIAYGADLFIHTVEAPTDDVLKLGFVGARGAACLELITPWYLDRIWEDLVTDLIAEVNASLAAQGCGDVTVQVDVANLPSLPATTDLSAQLIYMKDVGRPVTGVALGNEIFSGSVGVGLYYSSQYLDAINGETFIKADILAANTFGYGPYGTFTPPFPGAGYQQGPEETRAMRLLNPGPTMGAAAGSLALSFFGLPLCGQDRHRLIPAVKYPQFRSSHFCKAPSQYVSSSNPKSFYRCMAYSKLNNTNPSDYKYELHFQLARFETSDDGGSWTVASWATEYYNLNIGTATESPRLGDPWSAAGGKSTRPSFKCFQLDVGATQFLFCAVNIYQGVAGPGNNALPNCGGNPYFKTSATDVVSASSFLPSQMTSFIGPLAGPVANPAQPINSSGFVYEYIGGTVFFFSDRADHGGVDLYYYNGSTFVAATFVDATNRGVNLVGGDFINAVFDLSDFAGVTPNGTTRHRFYVMVGKNLVAMTYTWAAPTFTVTAWQEIPIDAVNWEAALETNEDAFDNPGAIAWLTCPVVQANPHEPDYTATTDSLIVGTATAIYIVSNAPANIVDLADFDQLSVAGALAELIVVRGYQMLSGADQSLVSDPALYNPIPKVTFKQRLQPSPTVIDLSSYTEACEDGIWLQLYSAVSVENSKRHPDPLLAQYNIQTLTTADGVTFTIYPPRYAGSVALKLDNRYVTTASFARLLANLYAQEFLVPRSDATVVVRDPYSLGLVGLQPLDVIRYEVKPLDDVSAAKYGTGRVMTVDYGLDHHLLTVKLA